VTENSTTFEIGLLVPGLIAPLDPKAGIAQPCLRPVLGMSAVRPISAVRPTTAIRPTATYTAQSAMYALLKSFGCRPFAGAPGLGAGPASESLVRRKPRGGSGAGWLGASYGDLKVADGSAIWRRGRDAAGVGVGSEHDALFRGRGCERRVWARQLERVCGGREDIALLLRRVVGDEDDRRCAAGSAAIVMRCRS
jgi:hypothetical protein